MTGARVNTMQKTSVTLLLDRSGSMDIIKDDTIGGFNAFVEGLQSGAAADDTEFTFVQFDSQSIDKIHVSKPVKDVPKLDKDGFQPRSATPLIDAAYKTIKAVEKAVEGSDKKVVVAIQTDGLENASVEHTWADLNRLIKEKTTDGWQFNFLGTGIDAYNQSTKMGIDPSMVASSGMSAREIRSSYRSMSHNVASYASGQSTGTCFQAFQKADMGDKYDPVLTADPSKSYTRKPKAPSLKGKTPTQTIVDDIDLSK